MELPSDLIELQHAYRAAEQTYADYVTEVETRRRTEHPDDIVARRSWTDDERAEDARLREAVAAAASAVYAHPALGEARTAGQHYKTWQALKDVTRAAA
ncbi:hypothetical protein TR51_06735 [Kitasatospora griseola]|uniref:Uncharacterized protein n=1 Tax=Kitasatospora griseola TaxID=2064 RepID=A0A0D0PXC0_KITGR|nr:hypothetical protein [Kitasatospora griseola]KIQ67069.1 hypothetical protein TR51_06735 [Kitasatospora griseola]